MSKLISDLDPRMQAGVDKYMRRCAEDGQPTIILETRRLLSTQMAYYARGRAPRLAKEYFARCGLWALSDSEAATINTQTLYSKHLDGLAVDIAPMKDGKPWWDAPLETWERIWLIAEDECGLDACAGGKWQAWKKNGRPWDLPHYEFRTGI